MLYFLSLIKAKSHRPKGYCLCSDAVRFRYSYSDYRQTFSSSIALCMSYLVNSFCLYFAFFCRLFGVNSLAYRYMIRFVFLFYHKLFLKTSLFNKSPQNIKKIIGVVKKTITALHIIRIYILYEKKRSRFNLAAFLISLFAARVIRIAL